jgi:hypothetical protein
MLAVPSTASPMPARSSSIETRVPEFDAAWALMPMGSKLEVGQCLPGDDYGHRDLPTIDSAMAQRARHARGTDVPVRGACRRPFPVTWGTATGKRLGQDAGNATPHPPRPAS